MSDVGASLGQEELIQRYFLAVRDVQATRYAVCVATTLVVFDHIITLQREVDLIWRKRWSAIKGVFLWYRYFGLACLLFQLVALTTTSVNDRPLMTTIPFRWDYSCSFWFRWETWGYSALLFTSEAVLIMWIWVIYHKNRILLYTLLFLFAAEVVAVIAILVRSLEHFEAKGHTIPHVEYCVITHASTSLELLWIPILAYDSILLTLFLYKGFISYTSERARNRFGVLNMVYEHSLLNFLAIFASYLACAVMWTAFDPGLAQIPVSFAIALSITNCTRLLLNIRRAYYTSPDQIQVNHPPPNESIHSGTPIAAWNVNELQSPQSTLNFRGSDCDVTSDIENRSDGSCSDLPRTPPSVVFANETSPKVWQYELRQMKAG